MNPTSTQLRVLQKGSMRTRLDSSPAREKPPKRECAEPGCGTLLCSYNEGDQCAVHRGWPSDPVTSFEHREDIADVLGDEYEAIDKAEGKT